MNSKLTLGAQALAACLLLGSIPAGATMIDIGLAESPGISNITTEAYGTGATGVAWAGLYDKYNFDVVMASDADPIGLTSGTIDVKGPNATAAIYLYVTETGLTSSTSSVNFSSIFGISNLPAGWSLTESTYLDNSNTEYGTGTLLASTQTETGKIVDSTQTVTTAATVGSTFSLTEVYELSRTAFPGSSERRRLSRVSRLRRLLRSALASLGCWPSPEFCSGGSCGSVGGESGADCSVARSVPTPGSLPRLRATGGRGGRTIAA